MNAARTQRRSTVAPPAAVAVALLGLLTTTGCGTPPATKGTTTAAHAREHAAQVIGPATAAHSAWTTAAAGKTFPDPATWASEHSAGPVRITISDNDFTYQDAATGCTVTWTTHTPAVTCAGHRIDTTDLTPASVQSNGPEDTAAHDRRTSEFTTALNLIGASLKNLTAGQHRNLTDLNIDDIRELLGPYTEPGTTYALNATALTVRTSTGCTGTVDLADPKAAAAGTCR